MESILLQESANLSMLTLLELLLAVLVVAVLAERLRIPTRSCSCWLGCRWESYRSSQASSLPPT